MHNDGRRIATIKFTDDYNKVLLNSQPIEKNI